MKLSNGMLALAAALAVASGVSGTAQAQDRGTSAQHAQNVRATADLRARLDTTTQRIAEAERSGKLPRARATAMRRQVAQADAGMTRLSRRQGFVSAAALASYERTLGTIDVELDRRGVARSYGNDALVAPLHTAR